MTILRLSIILSSLFCLGAKRVERSADSAVRSIVPIPKIAFFNPSSPGNTYWPQVFAIIEEVGQDLGFEFLHYDLGVKDRYALEDAIRKVLASNIQLDAVMASTTVNGARRILDSNMTKDAVLLFEGPLFPFEMKALDSNAKKNYPNWLGFFQQNESEKGYQLARHLIEKARAKKAFASDGKIHVLGVSGATWWYGSSLREAGLKRAIKEASDVVLDQVVSVDWSTERAFSISKRMLERFPQASVIWAASDQMGVGAADALEKAGRKLGVNAFTGGLDFSDVGMEQIRRGRFEASAGSPPSYYAKIAVYVYDALMGAYPKDSPPPSLTPEVYLATSENVASFSLAAKVVSEIDFKEFSMRYHPELKKYDFSWQRLTHVACRGSGSRNEALKNLCSKKF